ncbi:hypothetical protein AB0L00_12155 [Actinoallomurus sp. NPDC052308]|uniref:hypothetical protein n=1 Tax=Actinoallomurus sp. NPDC052308 TaxID=3155530 RepID=UPI0034471167
MVVLGSQAGGLSVADFMVDSLNKASPGVLAAGATVHGGMGSTLGWYLTASMRRSSDIAIRIMAFIGTLAVTEFLEVYALAVKSSGLGLGPAIVPDMSFVVGVILYAALTLDHRKAHRESGRPEDPPVPARPSEAAAPEHQEDSEALED